MEDTGYLIVAVTSEGLKLVGLKESLAEKLINFLEENRNDMRYIELDEVLKKDTLEFDQLKNLESALVDIKIKSLGNC